MNAITIIALDPGGTTGWSLFRCTSVEGPDGVELYNVKWHQSWLDTPDHHAELYTLLEFQRTQEYHIVVESFEYRNDSRSGLELISKEYIGVAKLFFQQCPAVPPNSMAFQEQTASMGKGFVKDTNIKRLSLWASGSQYAKHANDATRHLLYYMIHTAGIMRQELLQKGWK